MTSALTLRILDPRTGEARTIRVLPGMEDGSAASIGSHASCNVVLVGDDIAATHAYAYPVSYHFYVEALDLVRLDWADGREVIGGEPERVDERPFAVGPFQIQRVDGRESAGSLTDVPAGDGAVRIRAGSAYLVESPLQAKAREQTMKLRVRGPTAPDAEVDAIMAERAKRVEAGAPCKGCRSDDVCAIACARCGTPRWALAHLPTCTLAPSKITSTLARCARCGG